MEEIVSIALLITLLVNIGFLSWRVYDTKDISIVGSILPRVYLVTVICFKESIMTPWEHVHIGVIIMFISDMIINIFRISTRKMRKRIERNKLIQALNDLQYKHSMVVDTIPIGLFTSSSEGIVEYTNPAFTRMVGEDLVGKDIFSVICPTKKKLEQIKMLKEKEILVCNNVEIQTSGGKKMINFLATKTRNGHETITGSIQEV